MLAQFKIPLGLASGSIATTPSEAEHRYSPATCIGCDMKTVRGVPDPAHVSTGYVERQNLTMRMSMRRFTRLTNAFSKKVENHGHAVALYFMFYNFCRVHQKLRVTPAMEVGLGDHVGQVEETVRVTARAYSGEIYKRQRVASEGTWGERINAGIGL